MRYYFVFISIVAVWIVGVIIAHFVSLGVNDRLLLYVALMIFTLGMYAIGFSGRKA
jgi:hypothetical protein